MKIVVISPYTLKAKLKFQEIINKRVKNGVLVVAADDKERGGYAEFNDETGLEYIQALPSEIEDRIRENYFHMVFLDDEYNAEEEMIIRNNLIGTERTPVVRF